jgi:hypothetical protein
VQANAHGFGQGLEGSLGKHPIILICERRQQAHGVSMAAIASFYVAEMVNASAAQTLQSRARCC